MYMHFSALTVEDNVTANVTEDEVGSKTVKRKLWL